jgi:DNA-binding PadR family transcriptional regulator
MSPIARRIRRLSDREVIPATRNGRRTLSLTCAAALWALTSGPTRGPMLIAALDSMGLAWTDESFYQGCRRWERLGLLSIRKVRSRDAEAGAPGAHLENLLAITARGRRELADFLAVADLMA